MAGDRQQRRTGFSEGSRGRRPTRDPASRTRLGRSERVGHRHAAGGGQAATGYTGGPPASFSDDGGHPAGPSRCARCEGADYDDDKTKGAQKMALDIDGQKYGDTARRDEGITAAPKHDEVDRTDGRHGGRHGGRASEGKVGNGTRAERSDRSTDRASSDDTGDSGTNEGSVADGMVSRGKGRGSDKTQIARYFMARAGLGGDLGIGKDHQCTFTVAVKPPTAWRQQMERYLDRRQAEHAQWLFPKELTTAEVLRQLRRVDPTLECRSKRQAMQPCVQRSQLQEVGDRMGGTSAVRRTPIRRSRQARQRTR